MFSVCVLNVLRLCKHVTCVEQDIVDKNHIVCVCVCVCVCDAKSHRMYERKETKKGKVVLGLHS